MGALRSFLLVDDSRVCVTNTGTEVECILRKILTAPVLVAERSMDCDRMLPEIFVVLVRRHGWMREYAFNFRAKLAAMNATPFHLVK